MPCVNGDIFHSKYHILGRITRYEPIDRYRKGILRMKKWRNVTGSFSESQRYYKDMYLEIDEVYDEEVEVSLFSREDGPYEIYVSYGIMYGIIYVEPDEANERREKIKEILAKEYEKNKKPTGEFINRFCREQKLELPADTLFGMSGWMEGLWS